MKSITILMHNIFAMGGTVKAVTNLANQLAERGHPVHIISIFQGAQHPYFTIHPNIKVTPLVNYRLRPQNITSILYNRLHKYFGLGQARYISQHEPGRKQFNRHVERRLIKALQHVDTDVLISTRASFNILTAQYAPQSVEKIGMEHMNLAAYPDAYQREMLVAYQNLDKLTVLTSKDQVAYQAELNTPVYVIPNMIDEPRLDVQRQKVIVAAGRLEYEKGFDLLIESVNEAQETLREHDYQVHIYGNGQEQDHLYDLINQYQLSDLIQLREPTSQLAEVLASSQITVVPSRNEGFGMVILEAMNQGSIVLSYDETTGPASLINHKENGYILPHADTRALARQLEAIIQHPEQCESIREHGFNTVEKFTPDQVYKQFSQMIED